MTDMTLVRTTSAIALIAAASIGLAARLAAAEPPAAADQAAPAAGVKRAAFTGDRAAPLAKSDDAKLLSCPARVPAALDPPAGATLAAGMAASGVQAYVCTAPAAGGAPAWVLKAPHAVLLQGQGTAATHFSGPAPVPPVGAKAPAPGVPVAPAATASATAPTWQALDGSRLTGARVAAAAAPDGKSIPWLLLRSTSSVGPGLFGDVTWVQRLDTVGGTAPTGGCDTTHLGAEILVPYRADYFFYHPTAAGSPMRRCASN